VLVLRALGSVLAQTYRDLEAIVVIDGPHPETEQALASIQDSRLRVVTLETPVGPGLARNHGVQAARGAWVAFLDDDDEWLPTKLERQLKGLSPDQDVLVSCLSHVITPLAHYIWPWRIFDNQSPISEYLFCRRSLTQGESHLQTSTYLAPRRLLLRFPFRSMPRHEDWDCVLRLFTLPSMRLATIREPLVRHYIEEKRPSAGSGGSWRASLAWLDSVRLIVGRRAYSGFCGTVIAHGVALDGTHADRFRLLKRMLRYGAPTPLQLLVFALILYVPYRLRLRARSVLQRSLRASHHVV
jgi:glycosyltransferase involved in cell wall biosynthesis